MPVWATSSPGPVSAQSYSAYESAGCFDFRHTIPECVPLLAQSVSGQTPAAASARQAMERIRESGLRLLAGMMSQWQELMSFVYKSALLTYCMVARLLQLFFFQLALLAALLLFGNWFCFALDV